MHMVNKNVYNYIIIIVCLTTCNDCVADFMLFFSFIFKRSLVQYSFALLSC